MSLDVSFNTAIELFNANSASSVNGERLLPFPTGKMPVVPVLPLATASSTFEHTVLYLSAFVPSSKSDDKRDVIHRTDHLQIRIGLSSSNYFCSVPCRIKKERRRRDQLRER